MAELTKTRTDEELKSSNYNYYLAYNIKPDEKDDAKKIETVMNQRKNTFAQSTKSIDSRLKELFDDAKEIMKDNAGRKKEFDAAKKFKLDEAIKTMTSFANMRGKIYQSDIDNIVKQKWVTLEELKSGVKDVQIFDDTQKILNLKEKNDMEEYLVTLGKKDFYDFLDLTENDNIEALQKKRAELYSKATSNTNKNSQVTATGKLAGYTKIFENQNSKKNYDIYLKTKDIWDELKLWKSSSNAVFQEKELIELSGKIKIALNTSDISLVEKLLKEGLDFNGIIAAGGIGDKIDLEICEYCGKAFSNEKNPKSCPHCGESFEIICWNCGGKAPNTAKNNTCPTCGATKAHSQRFDTVVKKIENLLVQPGVSVNEIKNELNNLKNLLPDYNKAATSNLAKKAKEYQEKVDKKVKEEETVGTAYKEEYEKIAELVSLKKYITASGAVTALKNKYPTYNAEKTSTLNAGISSVVSRIKQHTDKAKTLVAQNNEDAALTEVAAALDLATDCVEAPQIISKFPPKAPDSISAVIKENSAQITWVQNKPQKLSTYTLIRKSGSPPASPTDGTVVASELSINFFEDKSIASDTPYYYAVFSSRLGVHSSIVSTAAPLTVYFDVSNIRQEIVSGKIVVKWEAPLNASEVEVIRKKGQTPPAKREDGQKISVKNNESFEDSDYDKAGNSYLFVCVYKNNRSKGLTRTFKTFEELKPLSNVKIEQNTTTSFTLSCDKMISGKRGIYYSTQDINCKIGSTLQVADFKNFYKGINEASLLATDDNTATFNLPPDKAYYVYPVVCNEQLLIVSKPIIVNTMIGLAQIAHSQTSTEVVITGRLHPSAKNIIAKVSNKAFPTTLDSDGDKISFAKDDFANKGGLHIKLKMNADNYITIFAETEIDGVKSITCGTRLNTVITLREKATVLYTMKYTVSAAKSFSIKIDFQSDTSATIPELMLVMGSPKPLNKNEGQLVDRTPVLTLKKGFFGGKYTASVSINSTPVAVNTKFALFPSADNNFLTLKEVRSL